MPGGVAVLTAVAC